MSYWATNKTHPVPSIQRVVGVNLDIPHWDFLSGIDTGWLTQTENKFILDHVLHCHISDHTNGHFGCSTIGSFHEDGEFGDWIRLVSQTIMPSWPNFSGFISCEMEGCKDERFVKNCTKKLQDLISKYA
jgi:hypothetical protein